MRTRANTGRRNPPVHLIIRMGFCFACGLAVVAHSCAARASESDGSADSSECAGLPIQGMPDPSMAGLVLSSNAPNASYAGNVVVLNNNNYTLLNNNTYNAEPLGSGTITFGGNYVIPTAGTLLTPAHDWTSTAGTLTHCSSATTTLTGTNVLTLAPGLTSGATLAVGSSPIWLLGNGGTWDYTGQATISSGTLTLSKSGTIVLLGSNSGGQGDGTIPEPAAGLMIFLASIAFSLRCNRALRL
jgi:hypothetical protein